MKKSVIIFILLQMESWVEFHSQQNISGTSQQNSDAAFPLTAEVDWWKHTCIQKKLKVDLKECYLHI